MVRHCGGRPLADGAILPGSPMFWPQRLYPEPPPIRAIAATEDGLSRGFI